MLSSKETAMQPGKVRRAPKSSRAAGLVITLGLVAGLAAQATPSTAATVPAGLAANAPRTATVAFRETIVIPAGSLHAGGSAKGVGYSIALPRVSDQSSICTLTAYDPFWYEDYGVGDFVEGAAYISCEVEAAELSVTVGVYYGISPYPLQGAATTNAENAYDVYGVENFPISENGYYITGAVGSVGSPVNGTFPEAISADTWVSAP
jgi:hypothetical protein